MALYAIGFLGTAPLGGPLVGWISQAASPRIALIAGAASALIPCAVLVVAEALEVPQPTRSHGLSASAVRSRARTPRPSERSSGSPELALRAVAFGSFGSPSTRSPTMLRWISAVPPQMVSETEKK